MNGFEQEHFAVHSARAAVGGVMGGTHPLEIPDQFTVNSGMNVMGLRTERRLHRRANNRLGEIIRRGRAQRLIDVREMLAIEFVELAVVRGVMLRTVPPVPIATLGDEQFFKGELALLFGNCLRVLGVEVSRVVKVVPSTVVFRGTDPHVEVGVDPGTGYE